MTRYIETSRKDAKAYPELGMRPTRIAAARPIAVRPPEANLGFTRIVDIGIRLLPTPIACD